jgi:hypothetical protein
VALAEFARLAQLAATLDPENAEALAVLPRRTSSINGDYAQAIAFAERAVVINSNLTFVWRCAGLRSHVCSTGGAGGVHFERALLLSPRDPRAHDALNGLRGGAGGAAAEPRLRARLAIADVCARAVRPTGRGAPHPGAHDAARSRVLNRGDVNLAGVQGACKSAPLRGGRRAGVRQHVRQRRRHGLRTDRAEAPLSRGRAWLSCAGRGR